MGKGSRKKGQRVEKGSPPEINAPSAQGYLPRPLVVLLFLSLLAILIYSNTFSSSFQFDDIPNIVENPQIKDLTNCRKKTASTKRIAH